MSQFPLALPWRNKIEVLQQGLKYISDRKTGKIKSLKCKSVKMNDAGCDGFEFQTAWGFAARPGGGKSLYKEQLIEEFFECNPDVDFTVLDWDLEMPAMQTALRKFSSHIEKSYKYLCSAEKDESGGMMSKAEFDKLKQYVEAKKDFRGSMKNFPFDVIENAPTVEQFEQTIESYMETHKTAEGYKFTVVSVDHIRLVLKQDDNENTMLYKLSSAIIRLKKKYPIFFLLFTHLNRSVTEAQRCENGKIANYIVDADIFGADALNQCVDGLVAMDRPSKRKIEHYGPERFIVTDEALLIFHFLKVRNGDTRISFMKGEFNKMRIIDMVEQPATARDMNKMRT